jgi:hypothetical protein
VGSTPTPLTMYDKLLEQVDKKDLKYVKAVPDEGFSPERNKMIIESSIRKAELMRKLKYKKFHENISERSEAVASFLKHVDYKNGGNVENYFGRKTLNHLRGMDIVDELRSKLNMISTPSPCYVEGGMVKSFKGGIVGREVSNVKKKLKRKEKLG